MPHGQPASGVTARTHPEHRAPPAKEAGGWILHPNLQILGRPGLPPPCSASLTGKAQNCLPSAVLAGNLGFELGLLGEVRVGALALYCSARPFSTWTLWDWKACRFLGCEQVPLPTKSHLTCKMDAYTSPREIAADSSASPLTLVGLSKALPTARMSPPLHAA